MHDSRTMKYPACLVVALLAVGSIRAADAWKPLFNGKDLSNWDMFLAIPDPSVDLPGLKRSISEAALKKGFGTNPCTACLDGCYPTDVSSGTRFAASRKADRGK